MTLTLYFVFHGLTLDIYTEPELIDADTLANLGPLRALAGIFEGTRGLDVKPKAEGPKKQAYVEHIELQPINPQTNGPQLLYGLRCHSHVTQPDQVKTYHDQVGYWLWEPATGIVMHTLTIPRGQIDMAAGQAAPDAKSFELVATQGLDTWGICSAPFLHEAIRTTEFRIKVTSMTTAAGAAKKTPCCRSRARPNLSTMWTAILHKVAQATPNPLARR